MKLKTLLMLMLLLPLSSLAQKEAYAVFKDSTLTFYYNDKKPKGAYGVENLVEDTSTNAHINNPSAWFVDKVYNKEWFMVSNQIKTVVFDNSFKEYRPINCSRWFYICKNLTSIIGMKENLNTSKVIDMSYMFYYCKNLTSLDVSGFNTEHVFAMNSMFAECFRLTSLDLSGFNTENVIDMTSMFSFCENVKTIYVGDGWNTSNVLRLKVMFYSCNNLVGEQGTKYHFTHDNDDASYAHIDGGESNPGYLTKKTK